jgi:hypothetical protein
VRRKKVKAKARSSRSARNFKRPRGEFSQEGKSESLKLQDKKRKLNEGRTHEFPIDTDGHFILISYKPTTVLLSGRSRIAFFDSNLPDPERFEHKTMRRLYDAAFALESGAVGPKLRLWLANALRQLAEQVDSIKPNWDARIPFGMPESAPGRPANAAWTQPFLALDVELGRAAGQTAEHAIEKTGKAWLQGYEVVEKAHKKWGKVCRKIVSTVKREDGRDGISLADSMADHQQGLRMGWAHRTRIGPGYRKKTRAA